MRRFADATVRRCDGSPMRRFADATVRRCDGSPMRRFADVVINLLGRKKPKNMVAQLEDFADKFLTLIQFMNQELVL
ncbi:hypothetical protein [Spirosoma endbachense]|uniref:Uncharacterized protein n=1 Tax=Spirosoma endbachense TaxID=2666025 RepID=A0A6P1W2T7_9BACT|nr:hypothetical protein [Spirosoma endbachense]QHV98006.1 hypothetical protein GJR95_24665 [Spirosoma endbachense]